MKLPRQELTGRFVRLEPLDTKHREGLRQACAADPAIWEIYPWSMLDDHYDEWWSRTVTPTSHWNLFATIFDGAIVGLTGFVPEPAPGVVHVGSTYFHPEVRGGPTNTEAKLLLLTHAFDGGARRVAFNVDPLNARSRAAMRKLGAVEEGITREASVTWTGRVRDLVVERMGRSSRKPFSAALNIRMKHKQTSPRSEVGRERSQNAGLSKPV